MIYFYILQSGRKIA